jgi:hypothetical protein
VAQMRPDEIELWREPEGDRARVCVMISCCSGAELQVRRGDEILLRELYPDKPTVYERAAQLRAAMTTSRSSTT